MRERERESNIGSPSFTLLELLIVIAILAVLSAVTVVVLNPAEMIKRLLQIDVIRFPQISLSPISSHDLN